MVKLRIGILGRGLTHLRNFLALPDSEVIGACDRLPLRREAARQLIHAAGHSDPSPRLVPEFEELLALRPDAVVVASNGKLQVDHAIQAMQAGCHVLSEVPGMYTQAEAVRLRDAVERTGKAYMLGENTAFREFFRYFRKWVVEDRFGPISIAEGEYLHYIPATLRLADGTSVTPSEAQARGLLDAEPTWRADQPPIQYLTHDLGPLLEVLDDRVVSVTCRSAPWRNPETPLRSDGQIALFQTAKGTLIKIMVTLSTRRPVEHRFRLFGISGGAECFSFEHGCRRFTRDAAERDGWEFLPVGFGTQGSDDRGGHGGADARVAYHFTHTILQGKPSPVDVYRAIEFALPGILANNSAALGGTPVDIPDLRRQPFPGTRFWDTVGLPDADPPATPYRPPAA